MDLKTSKKIINAILFFSFIVLTNSQFCFSKPANRNTSYSSGLSVNKSQYTHDEKIAFQRLPLNFEYNGIRCILRDHTGYMWFGTTAGLIRYDGYELYRYENDPNDSTSLSHNGVNAILEDKENNLWIGTCLGLNLYNRNLDNFIRIGSINDNLSRLNSNYVRALGIDNKSIVWVGTIGDGVNLYNSNKQTIRHYSYNIDNPESVSSDRITCIVSDHEGHVWLGTQYGLNLYLGGKNEFRHFFSEKGNPESLSNNNITSLVTDINGTLWIGTSGGGINKLRKINNEYSFQAYQSSSDSGCLSNNFILSLETDTRGNLWIGTDNGGLNRMKINADYFDVFQVEEGNPNSILSNSIWSLYRDDEGRLWIGTYNKGINVIDERFSKFESYQRNIVDKNSLTNNDVRGFAEDHQGNIWIATDGGGICRFNPESRRFDRIINNSEENNYLENNAIQTVLFDSKENIWIGTWAGGIDLLNKNGERITNYKLESEQGIGNNNTVIIYEDSKGNIWAGTAGSGLFKYEASTNTFNQVVCRNPSAILTEIAYVTAMLEDSRGSFWIGTFYGIVILEKTSDQKYTCINFSRKDYPGLNSNMINVIYEDRKDRLWFGTEDNGIYFFDRKRDTFIAFQIKEGLPSNSIRGILEDDNGYLWITTSRGLSKFNFDSKSFTNYTREDGLNSNELYARSCLRTKRGEFYIGGENGFNVFFPDFIKYNSTVPPICFTNFKINNVSVNIGNKTSPLKKNISETTEITLRHNQSSFTIEFAALNYTRSSRNQYSYKLAGFDDQWIYAGNKRSAIYTKIKPGEYVFLVKGSNNDGIWNSTPAALKIRIKPPLWKTWWALFIYTITFSALVSISLIFWNERIRIRHQLRLEKLAREQEHELNEANIQFFTNISHEFRTPLSLIITPLENIIQLAQSNIKDQLVIIYRNARRLLHLTNNLLDFRKLEEGRSSLNVKKGEIVSFISDVSSYFSVNFKRRQIKFSISPGDTKIQGWFDPEKLETILLNLLSNASRFTADGGHIEIALKILSAKNAIKEYHFAKEKLHPTSHCLEIRVIDNGSGISAEDLPYIFEKFYQPKSQKNKKSPGTGIGLTLTKGLIELHHGVIQVTSKPDKRTTFSFILPIDAKAYTKKELILDSGKSLKKNVAISPGSHQTDHFEVNTNHIEYLNNRPDVLIVEDNDELRIFLASKLNSEFNVIQAENGKKGIEEAFEKIPDLIVSDILMPQCSGIELCKTIKSDIRTSHIPVVLLSAKTTIFDQIEGFETGADAYINKPFNLQFLSVQINQLIQSRRMLFSHFSQDVYMTPNKLADNKMDQKFLQKVTDYILQHISDNALNVEELAGALHLSRSNVYRKIKALTGNTIIEFIRIIRLKHAIKLMETKEYTLAEIAYMTGFNSPSYFTKSFRDHYGKPPSEFLA